MTENISFIIGNFFSLLSAICTLISVTMHNKKRLIQVQTIGIFFYIFTNIFLHTYTALVSILIALIRNILSHKNLLTKKILFVLCLTLILYGIHINNLGIMGFLPIIAIVIYSIMVYITKNEQQMRYAVILNMTLWFIQNMYIKAYPSAITNILVCLWTTFHILKNRKCFYKKFFNTSQNKKSFKPHLKAI